MELNKTEIESIFAHTVLYSNHTMDTSAVNQEHAAVASTWK